MRRLQSGLCLALASFLFFLSLSSVRAEELTILYSGETHAMLYPCNCPREPDGGVARRASLVKLLRKKYPASLLLDSGGFFGGGSLDEYTQNTRLDLKRTRLQLKAMELMEYDAAAVSGDEFYFGADFLYEAAAASKIAFLSSNLQNVPASIKPYTIKEIGGVKFGIIGVTPADAQQKDAAVSLAPSAAAVSEAVSALRQQGVDIIVVLARMDENQAGQLAQSVPDIDIIIAGQGSVIGKPFSRIGKTVLLKPAWQGRRIGVASLTVTDGAITDFNIQEVRLSPQVPDDPQVSSFLPACFTDSNCSFKGLTAECIGGGTEQARCEVPEAHEVEMLVITSDQCVTCQPELIINELRRYFPRLKVSAVNYPGERAEELLNLVGHDALPVYLISRDIEHERSFNLLRGNFDKRGEYYVLKTEASGISLLYKRPSFPDRFDLFIRLFDPRNKALLDTVRDFNPVIHFLVYRDGPGFKAEGGNLEVEDALRAVCIRKHYPERFYDYIGCRAGQPDSSWWESCIDAEEKARISACATTSEGTGLLEENSALTEELKILTAPTYLLNNRQIFSSDKVPREEDLRAVIENINQR